MARPINETAADRERERQTAEWLGARWKCDVVKMPNLYPCDYMAKRGKGEVKAFIEIKVRKASYPTLKISLMKIMKGVEMSEFSGIPFYLIVAWPKDGREVVMALEVKRQQFRIEYWGRDDRGQQQQGDYEPAVEIPMSEFKLVGEIVREAA